MKTNLVIKICLICLAVVAVTFMVLKLTLWKAAPEAHLKDLKKGTSSYDGSKANEFKKNRKKIESKYMRHFRKAIEVTMNLYLLKQ